MKSKANDFQSREDLLCCFSIFHRSTDDSDYAELVEDEDGKLRRRLKTTRHGSSKYIPSRFRLLNSIRQMPIRYQTAFLSSLGFLISFGIRCNMGVSVVAMTHNETEKFPNGTIKLIKVKDFRERERERMRSSTS